jgi:hypothetical protein
MSCKGSKKSLKVESVECKDCVFGVKKLFFLNILRVRLCMLDFFCIFAVANVVWRAEPYRPLR